MLSAAAQYGYHIIALQKMQIGLVLPLYPICMFQHEPCDSHTVLLLTLCRLYRGSCRPRDCMASAAAVWLSLNGIVQDADRVVGYLRAGEHRQMQLPLHICVQC